MNNNVGISLASLLSCSFLTVTVAGQSAVSTTLQRSDPVLVRYVVDGDTIDVVGIGRVRLLGIDAPELGRPPETPAPFATQAQERLASLVLNRWVRLQYDGERRDVYDRGLAYVMLETGVFVNAVMVSEGLARVSVRKHLSRTEALTRAEAEARAGRRGIWRAASPATGSGDWYVVPRTPKK